MREPLTVTDHHRYYDMAIWMANNLSPAEVRHLGARIKITMMNGFDQADERRNVLAQTLEDVRAIYVTRFMWTERQAQPPAMHSQTGKRFPTAGQTVRAWRDRHALADAFSGREIVGA